MKKLIRETHPLGLFCPGIPRWYDSKFGINFILAEPALLHGVFVDSALPTSRDSEWNESHAVINHLVSCIAKKSTRKKKRWCNIKNGLFCAHIYICVLTLKLFARPLFIFGSAVFAPSLYAGMRPRRPHTSQNDHLLPTIPARRACFICFMCRIARAQNASLSLSVHQMAGTGAFYEQGVFFF